jgi:hypothetical protein
MKKDKRAVKRNKECLDEAWLEMEQEVFSAFVCSKACLKKECESCFEKHEILIKCYHCKKHLCARCDLVPHLNSPFHQRTVFFIDFTSKHLLSHEFIDPKSGVVFQKGIIYSMD